MLRCGWSPLIFLASQIEAILVPVKTSNSEPVGQQLSAQLPIPTFEDDNGVHFIFGKSHDLQGEGIVSDDPRG